MNIKPSLIVFCVTTTLVEVRRQLAGVSSLLSPCELWGSNPDLRSQSLCPQRVSHSPSFYSWF